MFIHEALMNVTPQGEIFVTATAKPFDAFAEDMLLETEKEEIDEDDMNFAPGYINRNAFIVLPKTPFLNWRHGIGGLFPGEDVENKIYLLEEKESNKNIHDWLKKNYDIVFKKELENWCLDKKLWPQKRNFQIFCEWFTISYHSMIYDLESYSVDKDMP